MTDACIWSVPSCPNAHTPPVVTLLRDGDTGTHTVSNRQNMVSNRIYHAGQEADFSSCAPLF